MPEWSPRAQQADRQEPPLQDLPPAEIAEFIRYCHHVRAAAWPELYDVMCGVAARHEFHGLGPEQLADHGLSFALGGMPRLAAWVRCTVGVGGEARDHARAVPAAG
jgi:hypothetical protein